MAWWLWVLSGLILSGIELFTPGGFFLLFFGLGALIVGALSAVLPFLPLWLQVLLFTIFSVAGILFFRRTLVARFSHGSHVTQVDSLVGESAVALEDLGPGGSGRVELRGTPWMARNSGSVPIARGQRCTVEHLEGLKLWVRIAAEEYLADTRRDGPPRALTGQTGQSKPADGAGSPPATGTQTETAPS